MELEFIIPAFFLVAVLFSSVGHGGASGYLAIMSLLGVGAEQMRPTALVLNVGVTMLSSFYFIEARAFSLKILLPLIIASIPMAYLGGASNIQAYILKLILGCVLILSAMQLLLNTPKRTEQHIDPPSFFGLLGLGGSLGFLAGLSGVGGGIFLSPALYVLRWAPLRTISGISAVFILVNSISGLIAMKNSVSSLYEEWAASLIAVISGAWIGSRLGSKNLPIIGMQIILAMILLLAGVKMISESVLS